MAYLLDVNVLIALSWPGHPFHKSAQQWFGRHAAEGWATCPIVQAGFVRIISNPAFSDKAVTPKEALKVLGENLKHPGHHFWPDDISLPDALSNLKEWVVGPKQVTDAYLLSLAMHHRGKLATTDRSLLSALGSSRERSHVELIQ